MDIMESLRVTQKQLDKMTRDIAHLTCIVQVILCAAKQGTGTSDPMYSHVSYALNSTGESVRKAQMGYDPLPSAPRRSDENKTEWTCPVQVKKLTGTIATGGINVSRLRDVHKDQTNLE